MRSIAVEQTQSLAALCPVIRGAFGRPDIAQHELEIGAPMAVNAAFA